MIGRMPRKTFSQRHRETGPPAAGPVKVDEIIACHHPLRRRLFESLSGRGPAIDGRNAAADLAGAPLSGALVAWGAAISPADSRGQFPRFGGGYPGDPRRSGQALDPDVRTAFERIGDDYRYGWRQVAFRLLVLPGVLTNFGSNAYAFALILILQRGRQPPWTIGFVQTGAAVSGIVGALVAGRIVDRFPISTTVIGADAPRFATLAAVTLWHDNVVACIALTAVGLILTPRPNGAMWRSRPDEHLQGRVAFDQLVGMSLAPLAWAISTELVGLAVVTMISSRSVRRLPLVSGLPGGA